MERFAIWFERFAFVLICRCWLAVEQEAEPSNQWIRLHLATALFLFLLSNIIYFVLFLIDMASKFNHKKTEKGDNGNISEKLRENNGDDDVDAEVYRIAFRTERLTILLLLICFWFSFEWARVGLQLAVILFSSTNILYLLVFFDSQLNPKIGTASQKSHLIEKTEKGDNRNINNELRGNNANTDIKLKGQIQCAKLPPSKDLKLKEEKVICDQNNQKKSGDLMARQEKEYYEESKRTAIDNGGKTTKEDDCNNNDGGNGSHLKEEKNGKNKRNGESERACSSAARDDGKDLNTAKENDGDRKGGGNGSCHLEEEKKAGKDKRNEETERARSTVANDNGKDLNTAKENNNDGDKKEARKLNAKLEEDLPACEERNILKISYDEAAKKNELEASRNKYEEDYRKKLKEKKDKWAKKLWQATEKYEEDCGKWEEEKCNIATKLYAAKTSSEVYHNLLQDSEENRRKLEEEKNNLTAQLCAATALSELYRAMLHDSCYK
ncbi:uncharacterized protein LOC132285680 [Cornus florida]|uniref:uncharacterized protein LOC132285680 n=1 Tax=Cornus florida TaxID=4283 RepID=UPI0028A073C1|nr:uncharacterized protein LOC132285680 [Cornus florida]